MTHKIMLSTARYRYLYIVYMIIGIIGTSHAIAGSFFGGEGGSFSTKTILGHVWIHYIFKLFLKIVSKGWI
jgi:hypothetical protein